MSMLLFTLEFLVTFVVGFLYVAPIIVVLVLVISVMGYAICRKEGWSRSNALYYAFITATTVGYGDFTPRRSRSRAMAVAMAFCGLILTGIIVAVALNAMSVSIKNSGYEPKVVTDYLRKVLRADTQVQSETQAGEEGGP